MLVAKSPELMRLQDDVSLVGRYGENQEEHRRFDPCCETDPGAIDGDISCSHQLISSILHYQPVI